MPKVSIVMPVYNSEKYVGEAIQSILDQTYKDFELIVIDDCCKDRSAEVIKQFKDERIVFIQNKENRGFLWGLNYGIEIAKGEYIARLDDDDTAYPDRIEKQVNYLDSHKDIILLGTQINLLIDGKITPKEFAPIYSSEEIKFSLLFGNYCIAHSSFMMRKKVLLDNNIRYEIFKQVPDHHMQLCMCKYGKLYCLVDVLVTWRIHPQQSTQVRSRTMKMEEEDRVRCFYIDSLCISTENKLILKQAVCRDLRTKNDYCKFKNAFMEWSKENCLDLTDEGNRKCMQFVWKDMVLQQQRNVHALMGYMKSGLCDTKWLFTKKGIEFIIKCAIKHNKRWFPTSYKYDSKL